MLTRKRINKFPVIPKYFYKIKEMGRVSKVNTETLQIDTKNSISDSMTTFFKRMFTRNKICIIEMNEQTVLDDELSAIMIKVLKANSH